VSAAGGARLYFEDVTVGDEAVTPALTVTGAHVALYTGLAGDEPGDPDRVPDFLPLALATGLGWRLPRPPLAVQAFLALEWEILKPLRVGDTIRAASRATARRATREGGIVIEEQRILDQHGEVVQQGRFTFLVARRPPEDAP